MENLSQSINIVAELPVAPGNITVTPQGRIFLSLHQFYNPDFHVAELVNGSLVPFPNENKQGITFEAVLGIHCDLNGCLWILDNGHQSQSVPKLVAWDLDKNQLAKVIYQWIIDN
ncbi:MAG: hypothetical protein VKK42_12230 [Lyngbya sp.]|nr:hypothetical protein [Lyngbya sp.]